DVLAGGQNFASLCYDKEISTRAFGYPIVIVIKNVLSTLFFHLWQQLYGHQIVDRFYTRKLPLMINTDYLYSPFLGILIDGKRTLSNDQIWLGQRKCIFGIAAS